MQKAATLVFLAFFTFLTACSGSSTSPRNVNDSAGDKSDSTLEFSQNTDESPEKTAAKVPKTGDESESEAVDGEKVLTINQKGKTVEERFNTPEGFKRVKVERGSFGEYLRSLSLKPHGSEVKYYNGQSKGREVHDAVLDLDVGSRDLQQCADAIMRLRSEYLYKKGLYSQIHFNFTNGFNAEYSKWMQGNRIVVKGNRTYWTKKTAPSNSYSSFRSYLDVVYAYAGTLSLSKEMKKIDIENMQIGDVFIKGGSPGHAVIVLDMAQNEKSGEKIFMLAQSYMPAQDIHILKNPVNADLSPWYLTDFGEVLDTPEWQFDNQQLMRFKN